MNQMWLKKIRVVVSLIFLVLTTLLFVDFERFGPPLAQAVRYPQFVPSLLNFTQTFALAATGSAPSCIGGKVATGGGRNSSIHKRN